MKSDEIVLLYLADPTFGGWVSFTEHLAQGFQDIGIYPRVLKISKRTEKNVRHFSGSCYYQNVSLEYAKKFLEKRKSIVVAQDKKNRHSFDELKGLTNGLVVHDPTEIVGSNESVLGHVPIFTIRRSVNLHITTLGFYNEFIRHPYKVLNQLSPLEHTEHNAVAYSRIDWDKNTNIIIEANLKLDSAKCCKIFGKSNRLYEYHKLNKLDPDWKRNYKGAFPKDDGINVRIASKGKFVVDLSTIKNDGGGTQYTFLEAWDASRPIIINSKWTNGKQDDMLEDHNCLTVSDSKELIDLLVNGTPDYNNIVKAGRDALRNHLPADIAKQYWEII